MGEEGGREVDFCDWKFVRVGEVGIEAKVFEGGPEKGTGRGGKGKDGRSGVVCASLVRLGGPQPAPAPFPSVRLFTVARCGVFASPPCVLLLLDSPLGLAPELRRGNKIIGTPDKNCLPGLPVIVSAG